MSESLPSNSITLCNPALYLASRLLNPSVSRAIGLWGQYLPTYRHHDMRVILVRDGILVVKTDDASPVILFDDPELLQCVERVLPHNGTRVVGVSPSIRRHVEKAQVYWPDGGLCLCRSHMECDYSFPFFLLFGPLGPVLGS